MVRRYFRSGNSCNSFQFVKFVPNDFVFNSFFYLMEYIIFALRKINLKVC